MREIKFRAWDKTHQKMFTREGVPSKDGICVENDFWGHFLSLSTGEVVHIMTRAQNQQDYREKVDFELMPYTGLKDKRGREIYTDDIIRIGSMGGKVGRVIFDRSCLAYMVVNDRQWTDAYRLGDLDGSDITIIGNIHENPELLDVDMSNDIEHDYTDEIVCPWCGYRHSDSWGDVGSLQDCDNCEKSFYAERHMEVTYSTRKANYGTCKHCGKEDVPVEDLEFYIGRCKSICLDCIKEFHENMTS